ncbi:hypothetical protein ACCS33_31795, partial [Rhizobium ruizarguesonis]
YHDYPENLKLVESHVERLKATQQNAAMVEQSTAAVASLSSEAGRLRDLVNQFQLDGDKSAADGQRSGRAFEGNRPIHLVASRRVTQR